MTNEATGGLRVAGVTKRFQDVTALSRVSLNYEPGKIYGLLGRNGAGKSTLLNIISGRLFSDEGEVTLDGQTLPENDDALGRIYCMSEQNLYPESMRVREAFKWSGIFYPNWNQEKALDLALRFELDLRRKITKLSTGYRSIFKAIVALCSGAPYLLFDEPVLGLDANNRDLFYKEMIKTFSEGETTIILSTHLIEEAADLLDHVTIIQDGLIMEDAETEALKSAYRQIVGAAADVDRALAGILPVSVESIGGLKSAIVRGNLPDPLPSEVKITPVSLQQLFIALTNQRGG